MMPDREEKVNKNYIKQIVFEELEKRDHLQSDLFEFINKYKRKIKNKSEKYIKEDKNSEKLEGELSVLRECLDDLNEIVFEE